MNIERNNTQTSFYELLIQLSKDEQKREEILPSLPDFFMLFYEDFKELDYPAIFSISYDSKIFREDLELLLQVLIEVENQLTIDEHKRIIQKMRRHFLLSYEQKIRIEEKSKETLRHVQSQLTDMESDISMTNEMIYTIQEESSKIYAQFVTILGIFTAIVVSVFGGLSIVSGVFKKINETPIWKMVLMGSLVSIFVLCLLFLLMKWISSIVQNAFGLGENKPLMNILTSHGAFATAIFIFCYLIITSVVFSSRKVTDKLKDLLNVWEALPILLLLTLPILAGVAVFIKIVDLKKYSK